MAEAEQTAETEVKSIVAAKYRDGRYKQQDWLGQLIQNVANRTKTVNRSVKDGDETKTTTVEVSDGIDIDALFTLAEKNGLDVSKYEAQRGSHGFPGRFRMTVRNMLQASAKRRHGINGVDGKFVSAPADWLSEKGAPEAPTHTQAGEKIAKPKPAVEPKAEKAEKAEGTAKPAKKV